MTTPHHTRHRSPAFTLIEIIVVLGLVVILVTATAPHVAGVVNASRLRTAADEVHGRLLEAQSLALLLNTDAELRFYEVRDLVDETARPTLRKLRLFTLQPPDTDPAGDVFEPAGAAVPLDQGVEISPSASYSSIVTPGFIEPQGKDEHGRYLAVRFRSDGSTALSPGQPWFLTVHEKDAHLPGRKLKNFVTIQIDPATGRLRTFEPG